MSVVLDASAVLAYVRGERGADRVEPVVAGSQLPLPNLAEVLTKHEERGFEVDQVLHQLGALGCRFAPVTVADARWQASVAAPARRLGLSLADRLCLAVGARLELPVLTADRAWADLDADLDLGVDLRLIR